MFVAFEPRIFGYARVSTPDQNLERQIEELKRAGVQPRRIFTEKESAIKVRPVFEKIINMMREGDKLVVVALDRAFRNTLHALSVLEMLNKKSAYLHIINMSMDTSTSIGKAMFTIATAFAEFEHNINGERIASGMAAARARGDRVGRPCTPVDEKIKKEIIYLRKKNVAIVSIAKVVGLSVRVTRRVLFENGLVKSLS